MPKDNQAAAAKVSIIIVTRHRKEMLASCLHAFSASLLPEDYEIILVINDGDSDLAGFLNTSPLNIRPIVTNGLLPAQARNKALQYADGEIIYFIDDDARVSPELFTAVQGLFFADQSLAAAGGPNLTPEDSSLFQKACGFLLGSRFGSGPVSSRYRKGRKIFPAGEKALTCCNLAVRRSSLAGLFFAEHLFCNEETALLYMLHKRGGKIIHCPDMVVYHVRRDNAVSFARQIFGYGRGRGQMTFSMPHSFSPFFLLPVLLTAYLPSLAAVRLPLYWLPLACYMFFALCFSLLGSLRLGNPLAGPLLFMLYPLCHVAYACGLLFGFCKDAKVFLANGRFNAAKHILPGEPGISTASRNTPA